MSLTSTQRKENNIVELEIAVGAEDLRTATDKVFKRKAKTITVPGFRKGKAPRAIIEKMYGESVFLEDAVNDLFPGAYDAAVEEAGIEPVNQASVELLTLDKETGFTCKATVTVKPDVAVTGYKGLKAEKTAYKVEPDSVDAEIDRMRENNARMIAVEDRPAKDGDITVIDFEGFVDGKAFEGGKGEGHQLVLGSGQFIPGFEEQIAGHSVGDEFDVNVTFPAEYHAEELKGKDAVFKVKLLEIQEKELPALDDEFAKDVSEFDTLDELKSDILTKLQEARDKVAKDEVESALMDQVIERMEADIPECMFESKIDEMVSDFSYRIAQQGMNMEIYLRLSGLDKEGLRNSFREQAVRQVKIRLALEKIVELEGVEVKEEDYDKEWKRVAETYGTEMERVRSAIPPQVIAADIKCTKAIDIVMEHAEITEKEEDEKKTEKTTGKPAAKKEKAEVEEQE